MDEETGQPKLSNKEILNLVLNNGLTITDVIDVVIEYNGIIGVGLITLGEQLERYVVDKISKHPYEGD